jgi:hypothetical protein
MLNIWSERQCRRRKRNQRKWFSQIILIIHLKASWLPSGTETDCCVFFYSTRLCYQLNCLSVRKVTNPGVNHTLDEAMNMHQSKLKMQGDPNRTRNGQFPSVPEQVTEPHWLLSTQEMVSTRVALYWEANLHWTSIPSRGNDTNSCLMLHKLMLHYSYGSAIRTPRTAQNKGCPNDWWNFPNIGQNQITN